jgi:hypothetical protein
MTSCAVSSHRLRAGSFVPDRVQRGPCPIHVALKSLEEYIAMPEFFEEQITEVKEQITEITEKVEVINTPQGPEILEQVVEVQEEVDRVQENITIIE